MAHIETIMPQYMDTIPNQEDLQNGILYISIKHQTAIHLCACGCKGEVVTPLGANNWTLELNQCGVTMRPSIGNWKNENPYHAHYFITNNKIEML